MTRRKTPREIHLQAMRIYKQLAAAKRNGKRLLDVEYEATLAKMQRVRKIRARYIDAIYRINGITCVDGVAQSGTLDEINAIWAIAATKTSQYMQL